ncbi:unnamed protein product [Rhodiola kirilowii]
MSRHPQVKWAQRPDKVYITIDLPDAKDVKLKLEPEGKFSFSAISGGDKLLYEIDFGLYDKVDVKESKANIGLRNICYLVKKAEEKWWSRLLKQEGKPPIYLKVDWEKWIDEDEEPEVEQDMDFGEIDFSKLNMPGPDEDDAFVDGGDDYDSDDNSESEPNGEEDSEHAVDIKDKHQAKQEFEGNVQT